MTVSNQIRKDLMELVKGHDWSYMMSDSHRVWEAGMNEDRTIRAKIHALIGVHKEDGEELYKEVKAVAGPDYSDYDKNGNGLKYRAILNWFKGYIDLDGLS